MTNENRLPCIDYLSASIRSDYPFKEYFTITKAQGVPALLQRRTFAPEFAHKTFNVPISITDCDGNLQESSLSTKIQGENIISSLDGWSVEPSFSPSTSDKALTIFDSKTIYTITGVVIIAFFVLILLVIVLLRRHKKTNNIYDSYADFENSYNDADHNVETRSWYQAISFDDLGVCTRDEVKFFDEEGGDDSQLSLSVNSADICYG